jgi:multisubunit Na+/H+ antiporter MnhB subunit
MKQAFTRRVANLVSAAAVIGFTAVLVWAILSLPRQAPGLYGPVHDHLPVSGSHSMVTAVLINFRGYDTLLELTVLLIAVIGVGAIRVGSREPAMPPEKVSPLLSEFIGFVAPLMVLLAGYLLWAGDHSPGGAFQAGAVLGALGILLNLSGVLSGIHHDHRGVRALASLGVLVFAGVGVYCAVAGNAFLEYPRPLAGMLILLIETAGTVAIGLTVYLLFIGFSGERS